MKLKAKDRSKINSALHDLCLKRLPALPLATINEILTPYGLRTEPAIYCGREGRCTLEIGADNSNLILYWLKGENDHQYEVNAYLS